MLALNTMDPTLQGCFFLAALICFALCAATALIDKAAPSWAIGAGLAFFTVPWMWNAFAAS